MKVTAHQSNVNDETRTLLFTGLFYFLILLGIVLWVRDVPNQHDTFTTTLEQVIKTSRMGDPISFATAALDIAEHGWISAGNAWILYVWPPGFILLEAAIVKTMGPEAPVILILQLFAAALLTVLMMLLNRLLRPWFGNAIASLLPLVIIVFPMPRYFLLQPLALTSGESYAVAFFLIAFICAIYSVQKNTLQYAVYAGIFFALAAYFRSQFELYLMALSAWGMIISWWSVRYSRSADKASNPYPTSHLIKTIALALVVAHLVTAPWRIYNWIHQDSIKWVHTSSMIFSNSVKQSDKLNSTGGGFVVSGGGNLTCRIDPSTCDRTNEAKKLFLRTFLRHPLAWYSLKLELIGPYWFSSIGNWANLYYTQPSPIDIFTNSIYLAALVGIIVLLCMPHMRRHRIWPLLMWINLAFFTATGIVVSLVHFEVRYFYFPKIYGVVMFLLLSGLSYHIHKDRNYKMAPQ